MKFTSISMLSLLGATMASIVPRGSNSTESLEDKTKAIGEANAGKGFEGQLEVEDKECIRPLLCCGSLTTPVDGLVDDILIDIGINGTELLGSIGLLCMFTPNYEIITV